MEILKGKLGFKGNKGETGEIGTPVPYDGTFEQLKNSSKSKYYNYIILDSIDTEYVGHWVYYDRNSSEWKDGGIYLSHYLTSEMKQRLKDVEDESAETVIRQNLLEQKYDDQIAELANQDPQLPEIVDARAGQPTLGALLKKKVYFFESVAAMKSCLTLREGDVVQTLGYYEADDGGKGLYKIVNDNTLVDDGGSVHSLTNGLKAKLIIDDVVNVKQFGAKANDETFDNQPCIQAALNTKKTVKIGDNVEDIYYINSACKAYNSIEFYSWIKMLNSSAGNETKRCIYYENIWSDKLITVLNPMIDGNRNLAERYSSGGREYGHGINIRSCKNIHIKGGKIINCQGDGICISLSELKNERIATYSENISIENVYIDVPFRNCISLISSKNILIKDCECRLTNGYRCFLQEPNSLDDCINEGLIIDGGYFYGNWGNSILNWHCRRDIKNITVKNCTIEAKNPNTSYIIRTTWDDETNYRLQDLTLENVIIKSGYIRQLNDITVKNNLIIKNLNFNVDTTLMRNEDYRHHYTSESGNICVENYNTISSNNNQHIAVFSATNGKIRIEKSNINSFSATHDFSGTLRTIAKQIEIFNNKFTNISNALSFTENGEASLSNIEYCSFKNNYIMGSSEYATSKMITVEGGVTINTLIVDSNILGTNVDSNALQVNENGNIQNERGDYFS